MSYSVYANIVHTDGLRARKLLDVIEEAIRYETIRPEWIETGMLPSYMSTGMTVISDEVAEHPAFIDETWHNDDTMHKVYKAMLDAGLSANTVTDIVMNMQNAGILFRERVPD